MPGSTRDARFVYKSNYFHRMGDLGYWDKNGNLRFMGRKAECIKTKNGPIETERYEPFVNTIDGIKSVFLSGLETEPQKNHPWWSKCQLDQNIHQEG